MAEKPHPLAKLINEGDKFIVKQFEIFKKLYGQADFNDIDFLIEFEHKADLWEKRVIRILKTYEKQNYIIKFQKPEVEKPLSHVYIAQEANNRIQAQLKILTDILTEIETKNIHPQLSGDNVYWIEYTMDGRILLNGKKLCQTQTNGLPALLFDFLMKNPNIVIKLADIEKIEGGSGSTADISHTLKDLGFNEEMKRMFFPILGNKKIYFKNPVDSRYLKDNHLPPLNLFKIWGEDGR